MGHGISRTFSQIFEHILVRRAVNERFRLTSSSRKRRPSARSGEPEERAGKADRSDTSSTDEVVHRMAGLLDRLREDDRRSLLSMAQKLVQEERDECPGSCHGASEGEMANETGPCEEF